MLKNKKTNLFVFGLGDKDQFDVTRYDTDTFNLVVGPTREDHKFLFDKYPYYRKSFECKKYSFCSDVGRLYMLSKNEGLYIDASAITGQEISDFIVEMKKFDVVAFRGNFKYVESGVLGSGKKDNSFYKTLLKFYEQDIPVTSFIMPVFLSKLFFDYGFSFGGGKEVHDRIALYPLSAIRNKKKVGKTGIGSGSYSSKKRGAYLEKAAKDGGAKGEEMFNTKTLSKFYSNKVERAMHGAIIDVGVIKMLYETGACARKMLIEDYKKINYKTKFSEKLIGSRLFVLFSLKGIKKGV